MSNNRRSQTTINRTRRQWLKNALVLCGSLSLSDHLLAAPRRSCTPPRIAVLDWTGVELLNDVGLFPLALCDIKGYRQWVASPPIGQSVIELGLRNEPNLELLAALKPDLIIAPQQASLQATRYANLGHVWPLQFYHPQRSLLTQAAENQLQLADLLQRHVLPHSGWVHFQQQLQTDKQQLAAFQDQSVLLFSLISAHQVLVLSHRSLFGEVLQQLGLRSSWVYSRNPYGSAIIGIERLLSCRADLIVEFTHDTPALSKQVQQSPLWKKMPLLHHTRYLRLPAFWPYGGLQTAARFAAMLKTQLV